MSDTGTYSAANAAAQSACKSDFRQLVNELREQNFDTIRFATYRTASKLRFIQKKVNLHLVDIWNVIESFRENGLNAVEYVSEVKISRIELLLSTVYHNLNKRLPVSQQIDTDRAISLLLSFLLAAYDRDDVGKIRVFSIKIALASLCAGKLLDKLRYVFSQISDSSGVMDSHKFGDYLREVLALPTAVFEGPTFGFSDAAVKQCFDSSLKVTVNMFLDTLMADPCPPCLMWLPLLHRMASVEHVFHPVVCDACGRDSFTGFRYKCQRCHNYQLCQDCFWRGRVSGSHTNQHEMKEYSSYKSPTKQLGHSISKSLQCMPNHARGKHANFPEYPDRPLDLSNVVPSSPSLVHNSFQNNSANHYYDAMSMGSKGSLPSPSRSLMVDGGLDDEHKLIARYSAKLAGRTAFVGRANMVGGEENLGQRAAIARLEQKNKDILREIQRLQAMQAASSLTGSGSNESGLTVELDTLRHRKYELEGRMQHLQDTRRDLMHQLESLMRVLRTQTPREGSPRSPSNLSSVGGDVRTAFHESTPESAFSSFSPYGANSLQRNFGGMQSSMISGDASSSYGAPGNSALMRKGPTRQTDLLSAADSITNTMSTLVKELGSDDEDEQSLVDNAQQQQQQQQQQQRQQQVKKHSRDNNKMDAVLNDEVR